MAVKQQMIPICSFNMSCDRSIHANGELYSSTPKSSFPLDEPVQGLSTSRIL